MSIILRDYQEKCVADVRRAFSAGARSACLVLPTGGGKTAIFTYIASRMAERRAPSVILVHRQELVMQTSLSLAKLGQDHSIIAPDAVLTMTMSKQTAQFGRSLVRRDSLVTIASIQTLTRRQTQLSPDLVIFDECHHAPSKTWANVLALFPNSRLLGVTATPIRLDGRGLDDMFEKMVVGPSIQDLIDQNHLAHPRVFTTPIDITIAKRGADFSQADLAAEMNKAAIYGCAIEHYRSICDRVPAIAFCVNVQHAQQTAAEFRNAGYRAEHIDGSMTPYERERLLRWLAAGQIDVLTSCDIVSEGTDVPLMAAAILLRPTLSLSLYLQQVGRALRRYPDDPIMQQPHMQRLIDGDHHIAYILDHAGNVARHGLPQQQRAWTLDGAAKSRKKAAKVEKKEAWQCKKCYTINAVTKTNCSYCNAPRAEARTIEVAEGKLEEVTEQCSIPELEMAFASTKELVERARNLKDLYAIARVRGYKMAWAYKLGVAKGFIKNGKHAQSFG